MELHLRITGSILVFLSLIHAIFPKRFNWEIELLSLSTLNRQIMYVHTFFIALMILLMGMFCIYCAQDIVHTRLGHHLSAGLFIFWGLRLLFQFFVYSPVLWKGKVFETTIHIVFSLLWAYFSIVFLIIAIGKL